MTLATGLFVRLTLLAVMLALGLGLRLDALRRCASRPALILRVLIGSCVLVPLVGLLLLQLPWSASIPQPERTAIALMALCPSAPLALRKARTAGGDQQLAAVMQVGAALLAIISVPLLGLLYRHSFLVEGWDVRPIHVAVQVLQVQVLPLLLGLALRCWRPQLADRLEQPLSRVANGLLVLLLTLVLIKAGPAVIVVVLNQPLALLLMALLAAIALLIGRLMVAGTPGLALTASLVTAMRNPGLALLFAGRHGEQLVGVKPAILMDVLVTLVVSLPLMRRGRQLEP